MVLESGAALARLWLEKEQLSRFALYLNEIISSLPPESQDRAGGPPEPIWGGGETVLEFKVGRLSLRHDAASNCFFLTVHDVEEPEEGAATLSFWLTNQQGNELAAEALKVCAAGRPRCFLCGQAINPDGHNCPRANGHASLEE